MTRTYNRQSIGLPLAGAFKASEKTAGNASFEAPAPDGQFQLAHAAYEPGTSDAERAALARTAIATHHDSFENMQEDAGEALQPLIDDDAQVLRALDASKDAVGEFPSDFGMIVAESINENNRADEEARHAAQYRAVPKPAPAADQREAYERSDPKHPDYPGRATV